MARYYQMFATKEERTSWENKRKDEDKKFRVCMRMTAIQLKKDLPFINIDGYKYATIWTNE